LKSFRRDPYFNLRDTEFQERKTIMRFTRPRLAFLTLVALFLAACDQTVPKTVVIYASTTGSYAPLQSVAQAGNSVPVYAFAAPLRSDQALAQAVSDMLAQKDPNLRFRGGGDTLPWDSTDTRILILNDMPTGYSGISACQGKPYEPVEQDDALTFNMIVCEGSDLLVQVMGTLPRTSSNLTAQYDELIKQTLPTVLIKEDHSPK
jgi:hypothetical protein|tara:strand:+ start:75888 stop:76502 length:615 start_codon:yes stop_codon:yes gene_type:complete